jgi:hypothetical protein
MIMKNGSQSLIFITCRNYSASSAEKVQKYAFNSDLSAGLRLNASFCCMMHILGASIDHIIDDLC